MATISEILDKIIKQYEPGAEFGKGERALLKRRKTKAMAGVGQQLASAGLAGTTAGAGAAQRWEEEIGMPAELKLEDIRTERLVQALLAKAGFIQEERKMQFQAAESARQRQFQAQRTTATGQFAPERPSVWDPGFLGGGWGVGGGAQPQPRPTIAGTHVAPDFTIPGGRATTSGYGVSDPTLGQEVYGPAGRFGGVATRGGVVGAERPSITSAAPESPRVGGIATPTTGQAQLISQRLRTMYPGRGY